MYIYKFLRPLLFETDWDRKLQLVMVEATGMRYISNLRKRHGHTGKFMSGFRGVALLFCERM